MAARLTAFLVSAIVAVTFVAGLIVGAQREDDGGPADLIIHNAHIYLGASSEAAEALAIRDGKIVRVGSNKEIDRLRRRQTLDADGGTVVAGLNDADLPLLNLAPDLTRAQRLDALKQAIADAHRLGLTSAQTTIASADDLALLTELQAQKALKLRVFVTLAAALPLDVAAMEQLEALRKQAASDDSAANKPSMLKVGAVRLTLKSAGEARGTQKSRGNARKAASEQLAHLADAIARLDRQHWQVIVNASTSAEATLAVDAFEQAFGAEQATAAIRARRHRLELSAPMDAALTARVNTLELVPSIPASAIAALAAAAAPASDATGSPADSAGPAGTLSASAGTAAANAGAPGSTPTQMAAATRGSGATASLTATPATSSSSSAMPLSAPTMAATATTAAATGAAAAAGQTAGVTPSATATLSAAGSGAVEAQPAPATQIAPIGAATAAAASAATAVAAQTAASAAAGMLPAGVATAREAASSLQAALAELLQTNPLTIIRSDAGALDPLSVIAAAAASAEPLDAIAAVVDAYTSHAAYATHDDTAKGLIVKDQAADLVIFSADIFAAVDRPLDAAVSVTIMNGEVVFTRTPAPKPAPTTN